MAAPKSTTSTGSKKKTATAKTSSSSTARKVTSGSKANDSKAAVKSTGRARSSSTANSSSEHRAHGPVPKEPKELEVVRYVLKAMGVEEYDDQVALQLVELVYRKTRDVLSEARDYSSYAGKSIVDQDDVRLAAQSIQNYKSGSMPPSRTLMLELAHRRNSAPLPPLPEGFGVHLPPSQFQLTSDPLVFHSAIPSKKPDKNNTSSKKRKMSASSTPNGQTKKMPKIDSSSKKTIPINIKSTSGGINAPKT